MAATITPFIALNPGIQTKMHNDGKCKSKEMPQTQLLITNKSAIIFHDCNLFLCVEQKRYRLTTISYDSETIPLGPCFDVKCCTGCFTTKTSDLLCHTHAS